VSFSIEIRHRIAEYVFAAAVSVAENMRTSLAAIGEEDRYAAIVSVSRVRRIREAFKIKAPKIGENIGNRNSAHVQEVKPKIGGQRVRAECGPPFLPRMLLVNASSEFFPYAIGDIDFSKALLFRLGAMLRLTNFKAGAQPHGSRNFTGTACNRGFGIDNAAFDNRGREALFHKPSTKNDGSSKIQALRLPHGAVNGAAHKHGP